MTTNLEIKFNTNIIKKIKSLNFLADQIGSVLFILFSLYEDKVDLLDEFDDYNKQKRAFILYKELELRKLIYPGDENDSLHYHLTEDGVNLVEFIKNEFKDEDITTEDIAIAGVEEIKDALDPDSWIDEWIEIFPRGIRSGGRLLRSDKQSCARKMKIFIREYGYSKDVIMNATKRYIEHKAMESYQYTRCAVYFIYRIDKGDRVSDLAGECEAVVQDKEKPNTNSNFEIMV